MRRSLANRARKVLVACLALTALGIATGFAARADDGDERRPLQAFVIANHGMTTTCPPGPLSCSPSKNSDDVTLLFVSSHSDDGGPAPTGTVIFRDRGTTVGRTPIDGWVAGYTVRHFGAGSHFVDAVYSGDGHYLPMTTATVHLVLNSQPAPATTVPSTTTVPAVATTRPTAPTVEPALIPELPPVATQAVGMPPVTTAVAQAVKVDGLQITRGAPVSGNHRRSLVALELAALAALVAAGATMARCGTSRRRSPASEDCS
jgi:hypothetical protein